MEEKRIFGAIVDTGSQEAVKHAEMYYNEIRRFTTDVKKISDNTGFSFEQILLVKDFKSGKQPINSGAIRRKLGNTTH